MNIPYFDINNMDGDENASVLISNPEGYLSQIGIQVKIHYVHDIA